MRGSTAGRGVRAASGTLLVAQVAFASVLLIGAGLLGRSFLNVLAVPPGFAAQTVLGARIAVPEEKARTFPPRLAAALAQLPGVEASLATATPFVLIPPYGLSMPLGAVNLRDYPLPADQALPSVFYCGADAHYRAVLQIPLRAGRWFDEADMTRGLVAVVDESFARRYFPAGDAVGRRLALNVSPPVRDEDWLEIVGVVGEVRHNGVEDRSGQPFLYLPLGQTPLYGTLSVLLRTDQPTGGISAQLRHAVAAVDPELPVYGLQPMTETIGDSFGNRRGVVALLALFAGTALLLTAVGLYGVLAYDVSRRSREIGIRSALGATRTQIALLVLRHGLTRTGLGVAIGLACALALARCLDSQLYAVKSTDPVVYWLAVAVLGSVALMACGLPARRATRVDPAEALRAE
jgi:predicted permease